MARRYRFGDWYEFPLNEEDVWYAYSHVKDEAYLDIAHKFREYLDFYKLHQKDDPYGKNNPYRDVFPVIKRRELIETWNSFIRHGKANVEMVEKFEEQVLECIARLDCHNALSGHDTYWGWDELDEWGEQYKFTEEEKQIYYDTCFGCHPKEGDYVSDYGLPQLLKLIPPMLMAKTPERKLVTIDKILNVVHMRGDLAAFLVEGGSNTLNELAREEEEETI